MINNYPLIINYSGLAFSRLLMDGGGGGEGGGQKGRFYQFSPVTSTNLGIIS